MVAEAESFLQGKSRNVQKSVESRNVQGVDALDFEPLPAFATVSRP